MTGNKQELVERLQSIEAPSGKSYLNFKWKTSLGGKHRCLF